MVGLMQLWSAIEQPYASVTVVAQVFEFHVLSYTHLINRNAEMKPSSGHRLANFFPPVGNSMESFHWREVGGRPSVDLGRKGQEAQCYKGELHSDSDSTDRHSSPMQQKKKK